MEKVRFDGVCAFMGGVWGRELSRVSMLAGWKLVASLPDDAVEKAVETIAEGGLAQLPAWSVIYKTAEAIAMADRELNAPLALPAGDALSDEEHQAAMIRLRAKETPEQRRRADAVTKGTKGLPMTTRLLIAKELLTLGNSRLPAELWNPLLEEVLAREFQLHSPLVPAVRADLA